VVTSVAAAMFGPLPKIPGKKVLPMLTATAKIKNATSALSGIQRINAAARMEDLSYSKLMGLIHKAGIEINRKVLADLALNNPAAFKAIVDKVKNA